MYKYLKSLLRAEGVEALTIKKNARNFAEYLSIQKIFIW